MDFMAVSNLIQQICKAVNLSLITKKRAHQVLHFRDNLHIEAESCAYKNNYYYVAKSDFFSLFNKYEML